VLIIHGHDDNDVVLCKYLSRILIALNDPLSTLTRRFGIFCVMTRVVSEVNTNVWEDIKLPSCMIWYDIFVNCNWVYTYFIYQL